MRLQLPLLSLFIFFALAALLPNKSAAQCPDDNDLAFSLGAPPCGSFSTVNAGAGTYLTFPVVSGASYTFSTCGTSWDTEVSGYNGSSPVFWDGDFGPDCPASTQDSYTWVSNFTGTLKVLIDLESASTHCSEDCIGTFPNLPAEDCSQAGIGSAVLSYRQNDNLVITSSNSTMCAGATRTLTATPVGGSFSGTGVSGSGPYIFTAPDANQAYTITYTLGQCSKTQDIQVYRNPVVSIAGNNTFCSGSSVSLSANVTDPGSGSISTYAWRRDGGTVLSGSQTYSANQSGDYTVEVTNSFGCSAISSPYTVTQNPSPTVSIIGFTTFCPGETVTLTANASGGTGLSYQWMLGASPVGGNSSTYQANTAGIYTVMVTNNEGCSATSSGHMLSAGTAPTVTVSGNNGFCSGESVTLTANASGGSGFSFVWELGNSPTGDIGPSITTSIPGIYTVVVTNSGGCTTESAPKSITQYQSPTATITGDTEFCTGESVELTANASGGSGFSYQWKRNGNNISATNNTYTATQGGTYTVEVTNSNGCSTLSLGFNLTESQSPTVSIMGNSAFCPGGSVTLTANATPGSGSISTYVWRHDGNIVGGNSSTYVATQVGTYTVEVTNSNGCSTISFQKNITESNVPTVNITGNTTFCAGGSVLLTGNATPGSGSITNYQWQLNGGNVGQNITTHSATQPGSYVLIVTNSNGCSTTSAPIVLTESQSPTVSISGNTTFCEGKSTLLTATASPGGGSTIANYQWKLNGSNVGGNSNTYTATQGGNYTVVVTNSNGCFTESAVHAVNENLAPTAAIVGNAGYCPGDSVLLTANATPGSGSIATYQWKLNGNPIGINSNTYEAFQPGNYTLLVTNTNGCSTESVVKTISESSVPSVFITGADEICEGDAINLNAVAIPGSGTISSYQWKRNGTNVGLNNASYSATEGGTYTVVVTNSNGCATESAAHNVDEIPAPTVSINGGTSFCSGSTILLTASASPGTGIITGYQWKRDNIVVGGNSNTYSATQPGTYTLVVTNSEGCSTESASHIIVADQSPTVSITGNTGICNGQSVLLTAVATPGSGSITTYQWKKDGGNVGSSISTYTATQTGDYTVVVTNSNGCATTSAVHTITISQSPTVSITGGTTTCSGDSLVLTANASPGSGSIDTYQWKRNGINVGTNSSTYYATQGGNYTVEVTNSNGCSTLSAVHTVSAQQSPTVSIAALSGTGAATGSDTLGFCTGDTVLLTTNASAGSGTITTYQWKLNGANVGANVNQHSTIQAGVYTVEVTNSNGCSTESDSITIVESSPPTTVVSSTDITCGGSANGTATVNPSGGTPPYSYNWNTNPVQTTQTATGLSAGTYIVIVTDSNGCTAVSDTVTINQTGGGGVLITITDSSDATCSGNNDGSITASASLGQPIYEFSINGGSFQSSGNFTGLTAGVYEVVVQDDNGCTDTATVTLENSSNIITSVDEVVHVECGADTGAISISVSGGTSPYTYIWSNDSTTQDLTDLSAGVYTVTVTDQNGCTDTLDVTILGQDASLMITLLDSSSVSCNGGNDGALDIDVTGGTPPYTYSWSNGVLTQDNTQLTAGDNYVVVTDDNGCSTVDSFSLSEPFALIASFSVTDVTTAGGSDGEVDLIVGGGTPPLTYLWSNSETSQDITGVMAGTYIVTITDSNGCTLIDSTVVGETGGPSVACLSIQAFLGGGYNAVTDLMRDDLRTKGFIPLTEPYSTLGFTQAGPGGGETVDTSIFLVSGDDAIVDWVLVELRDKNDNKNIVATRNALIQRDGDVVDTNGTSCLGFPGVPFDDYYISIRHRNHFGVMMANTISIDDSGVLVDFTSLAANTYGTDAQQTRGVKKVMWSGNVRIDNLIKYSGANNDRDPILVRIGGVVPTNVVLGYYNEDVNLDGLSKYSGANNDRDIILVNIGGVVPTAVIVEQLP